MTRNDDFIGLLEDYLDDFDDATPLPDRVRDAIRAELPAARQVRPRPGLERVIAMLSTASPGARMGLAATAVVVVVIVGAALLNNARSEGIAGVAPPPSPAATDAPSSPPTSHPSTAPSVEASTPTLGAAASVACDPGDVGKSCIPAGTYQLTGGTVWPATVTIDVPTGWFGWEADTGYDGVLVSGGPADNYAASGWGIMFATVADVAKDPCEVRGARIPAGQVNTPQKLAAAMASWPKFKTTTPQPITVDGHSGLKLQLTSTASCAGTGSLWRTTDGGTMDVYPMIGSGSARAPGTFEIVDTGRGLLVIRLTDFSQTSPFEIDGGASPDPGRHAADLAALHAILDSVRISTPAAGS